jgi:capping protein beta
MSHYKLTSTVILNMGTDTDVLGSMDLSGNMVRQVEQDMAVEDDNSHVINIGKVRSIKTMKAGRRNADDFNRWLRIWNSR